MKQREITIRYKEYESTELSELQTTLISHSEKAQVSSHSPYSNFRVGAAILLESGEIVLGSNQENAAYPSGLCAERTALFYANSMHPESNVICLVIVAGSINKINETPIAPCGGCRQVISEFENKQNSPIGTYFMGEKGKIVFSNSIDNLLPFKFDSSFL